MALTKVGKEGITGVSNASDATAITINSSENVDIGGTLAAGATTVRGDLSQNQGDYLYTGGGNFDIKHSTAGQSILLQTTPSGGSTTERMRIISTGNVGIGNTSPDHALVVRRTDGDSKVLELSTGDSTATMNFSRNGNPTAFIKMFEDGSTGTGALIFGTGSSASPAERMRIASDGAVHIRSTAAPSATVPGFMFTSDQFVTSAGDTTNDNTQIRFFNANGLVGNITVGGSSTTYNTSSDYRLKENVDYDWNATTRLKQLKPARFNFITDADTTVDGFIAHEAQTVVPESVTGTKDEVDEDGVAVMQSIDNSKLVPLLVKTIQELEARLTAGGL